MSADAAGMAWRAGGCHCGAVRFEALLRSCIEVESCNCTMCAKVGFLHIIVLATGFRLLSGADTLSRYTFGTGAAKHLFCSACGVKSYYVPRSNPDGFSINLRCLDEPEDFEKIDIVAFNGRHDWEAQAAAIEHKSKS
jgi:hypothetical protein